MGKLKKVYMYSRHNTSDYVSNNNFKIEFEEGRDRPIIHYAVVDISIPHTWYVYGIML